MFGFCFLGYVLGAMIVCSISPAAPSASPTPALQRQPRDQLQQHQLRESGDRATAAAIAAAAAATDASSGEPCRLPAVSRAATSPVAQPLTG